MIAFPLYCSLWFPVVELNELLVICHFLMVVVGLSITCWSLCSHFTEHSIASWLTRDEVGLHDSHEERYVDPLTAKVFKNLFNSKKYSTEWMLHCTRN